MKFRFSRLAGIIPSSILELLAPKGLFVRLDIASKMLSGYMVLVLLTVVVVSYALVSLQRLNSLHSSIVNIDVPVQEAADKMREAIIAQDTYEKKFLILQSSDMENQFHRRGEEFRQWQAAVKGLSPEHDRLIVQIGPLHQEYSDLFKNEADLVNKGRRRDALRISNGPLKKRSESIMQLLAEMSSASVAAQDQKMLKISELGRSAVLTTAGLLVVSILIGLLGSLVVTHHISSLINRLRVATRQIAEGNFDYDPGIRTNDEIGDLAASFVEMGKRLRKLEEMYLDASPLTRLPGGIAIENVLKKRIESKQLLAFCTFDLDNFKAFNDRYGYASGSEVIKETARIIETGVRSKGTPEDFIGHVGGDDFVVVTIPDNMRAICEEIIAEFDRRIPAFYDERDRSNGYILGKTRQGVEMKFPIMTISIAIVTNERREVLSPIQASEIAAELKDYAKTFPRSIYVIDKRRTS